MFSCLIVSTPLEYWAVRTWVLCCTSSVSNLSFLSDQWRKLVTLSQSGRVLELRLSISVAKHTLTDSSVVIVEVICYSCFHPKTMIKFISLTTQCICYSCCHYMSSYLISSTHLEYMAKTFHTFMLHVKHIKIQLPVWSTKNLSNTQKKRVTVSISVPNHAQATSPRALLAGDLGPHVQ